jgi:hypothetical protein
MYVLQYQSVLYIGLLEFCVPDGVLSARPITIFSKGLNYAQTTSLKSSLKDFISGTEWSIRNAQSATAEEIRQEISRIIKYYKP